MQDMKKLAKLLKEIESRLVVCMRCGMCQSVCPVFAETGRESDVARGKLALLDGLLREMFQDPKGVDDRLMRCLLCGSCAANCPSGVKVLDIFIKARAIITGYRGLNPVKKIIFRRMLARPDLFDTLMEWGAKFQGFFVKPVDELLGTSCTRFVSPLGDRHLKALAPKPFHSMVPSLDEPPRGPGMRVAFFTGCVIDKLFPHIAQASLKVLRHHGVGIFIPRELGCCGIPALSSGDSDTFNKLVRHNAHALADGKIDYLLTACATCTSTIKKLWTTMAEDLSAEELERVRALSEKTVDISQFLVDILGVAPAKAHGTGAEKAAAPAETGAAAPLKASDEERMSITYHDPCHLRKSLGIFRQPRALLQANAAYELVEMAEPDRCCGCGGSFNLQHYDISTAIGKRKRDSIAASGCSTVATSCPACMLQISDMLSQAGDRIAVRHTIEIYADTLDR